jgi:PqqD family protein of HPr-rel-A system
MTWRALPTLSESLFFWDDECVVFNHLSGDTHLLSALAGQLLLELQPVPPHAAGLAVDAKLQPSAQSRHEFDDILAELSALALIEHI